MWGSAALLVLVTGLALRTAIRQPALFVGWLWFAIALLPVIGLVPVGLHARADRYTYLPFIGLFVAIVWGAFSLSARMRGGRALAAGLFGAATIACTVATRSEVRNWRDSQSLFQRAIQVTGENAVAQYSLGYDLLERGKLAESIPRLREALRIAPGHPEAVRSLGRALVLLRRFDEAVPVYESAIRLDPNDVGAMNNLALSLLRQGDRAGALRWYRAAAAKAPQLAHLQHVQGMLLLLEGGTGKAVRHLERAVTLDPSRTDWGEDLEGAIDLLHGKSASPAVERLEERLARYAARSSSD